MRRAKDGGVQKHDLAPAARKEVGHVPSVIRTCDDHAPVRVVVANRTPKAVPNECVGIDLRHTVFLYSTANGVNRMTEKERPKDSLIIVPAKTKKIVINGREIGEVVESGDPLADLEAATKLMEAAGMGGRPPLEWTMYKHAQAFARLADYVLGKHIWKKDGSPHSEEDMRSSVTFVVNAAFAIEMYLKTLHALLGKKVGGHSLLKLYDDLPEGAQGEFARLMPARERQFNLKTPGTFRAYLTGLDTAFVNWRYVYERDYSGSIDFAHTMCVMATSEDVCRLYGDRLKGKS
jgi:hypothetical protein